MIKVWFLIIHSGVIVGTIGPSPLILDQCNASAQERTIERDQIVKTGINLKGKTLTEKQISDLTQLSFICIESVDRPVNGEPA